MSRIGCSRLQLLKSIPKGQAYPRKELFYSISKAACIFHFVLCFTMCNKQVKYACYIYLFKHDEPFCLVFVSPIGLYAVATDRNIMRDLMIFFTVPIYERHGLLCVYVCVVCVCGCASLSLPVCVRLCHELPIKDAFHSIKTTKNR